MDWSTVVANGLASLWTENQELASENKRLRRKIRRLKKLAVDWQDIAIKEDIVCPDGYCGACTMGNLSQLLIMVLNEEE